MIKISLLNIVNITFSSVKVKSMIYTADIGLLKLYYSIKNLSIFFFQSTNGGYFTGGSKNVDLLKIDL